MSLQVSTSKAMVLPRVAPCIRLRPEYPNHAWTCDCVEDRTHNGRKIRVLDVTDEFTRECLAISAERRPKAVNVIAMLSDLFILRMIPTCIRYANGPKFVAKALREWITAQGAKTAYILRAAPGKTDMREFQLETP